MDPSSLINEGNPSSFSLAEIWPFPRSVVAGGRDSSGILGIPNGSRRTGNFGNNLGFVEGNRDASIDESTVTEQSGSRCGSGGRKRREAASEDESSKLVSTSNGNDLTDCDVKRLKAVGSQEENSESKREVEESSGVGNNPAEQSTQPSEARRQEFIHVRARRGQATDSHSLAERARREKISERMKILQDLVPGCNKVIGKALVLDEIINYIQSLQHQVEFLSMKLEAVNSRMNPSMEGFPAKDFSMQTFDAAGMTFGSQGNREYGQPSPPEWLHMQVGGGFERAT